MEEYSSPPKKEAPTSKKEGIPVERTVALGDEDRRHFRVPHRLRLVNRTAYEPELVSIGPRYHNMQHLMDMELIKLQYFDRIVNRKGRGAGAYYDAINQLAEKACDWYNYKGPVVDIENMMLLDGCFIIELLLCDEPKDQIAKMLWSRTALFGDLLLIENQLPFFVIVKLYELIYYDSENGITYFCEQALRKMIQVLPRSMVGNENSFTIKDVNKIDHLLGLVHDNCIPSPVKCLQPAATGKAKRRLEPKSIRCARELEEAGVKFIKVDTNQETDVTSLFDVKFKHGKMKIPTFVIDDKTDRIFRNLIAYELFVEGKTYVIDYAKLMYNLVNTDDDVKLLRSCGVIENMLGSDEAVFEVLSKLLDNVVLVGDIFFYEEIFDHLKKHCESPWNTSKATFIHDYFNSPWKKMGLVAAVLTFLFAIIQIVLNFSKQR